MTEEQAIARLTYDESKDSYTCPTHGEIGYNTAWVRCCTGCDDGYFDAYEDDPIFFDPGDLEICTECQGKGGWILCGECNRDNPDAEF